MNTPPPTMLIHRADVLAILLANLLQGGDKPTLLAMAVAFGVDRDFHNEIERLQNQRVMMLERLPE